jgi:hypothetical protein
MFSLSGEGIVPCYHKLLLSNQEQDWRIDARLHRMFTEGRIEQQIEIRMVNSAYSYETSLPAILGLSFSFTEVAFGTPVH